MILYKVPLRPRLSSSTILLVSTGSSHYDRDPRRTSGWAQAKLEQATKLPVRRGRWCPSLSPTTTAGPGQNVI